MDTKKILKDPLEAKHILEYLDAFREASFIWQKGMQMGDRVALLL